MFRPGRLIGFIHIPFYMPRLLFIMEDFVHPYMFGKVRIRGLTLGSTTPTHDAVRFQSIDYSYLR